MESDWTGSNKSIQVPSEYKAYKGGRAIKPKAKL